MKKFVIIFLLSLIFVSCQKEKFVGTNDVTYKVYYFHPTTRCESCINIENFTKELVTTKYSSPLPMKYESLNIEEKENEHFRKDFDLKFGSVVITKYNKGQVEKYKNLDSIWSYSDNKFNFFKYADSEIQAFLK